MKVNWIVNEMCLPFSTFQSLKCRWKLHFSKNWNMGFLHVFIGSIVSKIQGQVTHWSLCDRGFFINVLKIITPTRPGMQLVKPTKAQCCFYNLIGISTQWHISDQIIHQWYIIIILFILEKLCTLFSFIFQFKFLLTLYTCNFYNEAHAQSLRDSEVNNVDVC